MQIVASGFSRTFGEETSMRKLTTLVMSVMVLCVMHVAAQQTDAVKAAAASLGADRLKTLQFTASGANFSVGQNFTPAEPWPRVTVKSYTASINFDTGSMRQELVREMGTTMPRGGGAPFTGEQRQVQVVSGNFAWNVGAPSQPAAPAPGNAVERMLMLWATPQGFVKAAMANNATAKKAKGGTEVSFTVGGKYKMVGIINPSNDVERGQTCMVQPIA